MSHSLNDTIILQCMLLSGLDCPVWKPSHWKIFHNHVWSRGSQALNKYVAAGKNRQKCIREQAELKLILICFQRLGLSCHRYIHIKVEQDLLIFEVKLSREKERKRKYELIKCLTDLLTNSDWLTNKVWQREGLKNKKNYGKFHKRYWLPPPPIMERK